MIGAFPLLYMPARYITHFCITYFSAFLFTMGCSYAIRRELENRRELHDAHEKLKVYTAKAEALAVSEERNRFAREIHDGVAQEALTNARKHAAGQTIRLRPDFFDASRTRLRVENSTLVQAVSGAGAFGLLSLRERMQRLGGTFQAGQESAGLFVVQAEIPA